jgi:hypothetical protein
VEFEGGLSRDHAERFTLSHANLAPTRDSQCAPSSTAASRPKSRRKT